MSAELKEKQSKQSTRVSGRGFRDIIAWQKARELAVFVYKDFGDCNDVGFKSQVQRAAVSVMNNIAEGHDRKSDKSFKHFLLIAKGSLAEVQSMLILAHDLKYLDHETLEARYVLSEETARIIAGLIKKLSAQNSRLEA